jgi:signal transduction histidine kinase
VLVDPDTIVLLSAPLGDALANVRLVRKSLVTAGSFALFISWLAGFGAAWNITRRLNRLETAAERIAGGDFEAPVEVDGRDEIGQLAAAFESMRLRLANLDRARREFIANASHELRTPLFSLGGFLELLVDEELEEATRREFLREMRAQVDRLTRLATDLLDLTRLDAGQLSVDIGKFDLAKVARTVVDEFGPVAEADGRALELVVDPTVLAAGDELRVQQITRILVENARRHTPSGTAVEVSVGRWEARALLAVRDAGPGIPPSDQEHLFERFYRAGGGKTSGSGLGLAIAQELALRMAGTLRTASAPGKTTFTLSLPLVGSLERAEEAETPESLLT